MHRFIPIAMIVVALARGAEISSEHVLDTLRADHPRLMLTSERLQDLKKLAETDAVLAGYAAQVLRQADGLLDSKPLEHKLIGPRLLSVSRECLERIYTLALAYRWSGEEKYARAAEQNLLTVCVFADWNPSHFLDTAEMSHAVGVGYDWLYSWLGAESRAKIKTAIIELGLKPGIRVYKSGSGWPKSDFNWNQVCNGGMMIGALAVAESDPEFARMILPAAVDSLPIALRSYDPDGAWMEGPGYWGYATRYTAYGLCALDTALGTDFGLSDDAGLRVTGDFPLYTTGPTGLYLNYADSGERSQRKWLPCLFWLASKYGNTAYSDAEHAFATKHAEPEHVMWYVPASGESPALHALDKHFRGKVDVAVMRSAWDDPDALFVGVKAGYNQVNHGHLDLGNFELDALGERWVRDLGSDDYNLPGYWDKKPGGKRWQYYRLNSASHSVPMINGESQAADAVAVMTGFDSKEQEASATVDLTTAYAKVARKVTREVALIEHRHAARVTDSFDLLEKCDLVCGYTTDAEIAIDGNSALLTLEGKKMQVTLESPRGALFTQESAEHKDPEMHNEGVRRLLVHLPDAVGTVKVEVTFAPVSSH